MLASEKLRYQLRCDHMPWSTTVKPGRFAKVKVEEGDVLFINNISLFSTEKKGLAEIYIGINKTKDDFLIGTLCGSTKPILKTDLMVTEGCTLGHSGYNPVSFIGYYCKGGSRRSTQIPVTIPQTMNTEAQAEPGSLWRLNLDLTVKVLAQLNCCNVAAAESLCKLFYEAGCLPVSYSNVDLSHMPLAEDLDALVMIRRSQGQLSSLVLGTGVSTKLYTAKCLAPLSSSENCLRKLHLFGLDTINDDNLRPPLSCCVHLNDLEIELRYVTIEGLLAILGGHHFNKLERLIYRPPLLNMFSNTISDQCLENFLEQCGTIRVLRLTYVFVKDNQVARILAPRRLEYLNLMYSVGFTGEFFKDKRSRNSAIQVLVLQQCSQLSEYLITKFIGLLNSGDYMNIREIYLTGNKGSEENRGITELRTARPMIKILTSTKNRKDEGYTEDSDYERINERIKAQIKPSTRLERTSENPFTDSEELEEDAGTQYTHYNLSDEETQYEDSPKRVRYTPYNLSDEELQYEDPHVDVVAGYTRRAPVLVEISAEGEEKVVEMEGAEEILDSSSADEDEDEEDTEVEDWQLAQNAATRRSLEAKRKEGRRFTPDVFFRVRNEAYNTLKMRRKYPEDYVGGDYMNCPLDGELRLRRRFIYW